MSVYLFPCVWVSMCRLPCPSGFYTGIGAVSSSPRACRASTLAEPSSQCPVHILTFFVAPLTGETILEESQCRSCSVQPHFIVLMLSAMVAVLGPLALAVQACCQLGTPISISAGMSGPPLRASASFWHVFFCFSLPERTRARCWLQRARV